MSSHRGMGSRPRFPLLAGLARRPKAAGGDPGRVAPPVIKLKSPREIALMREAGRVVAKALDQVRRMAVPGRHHRRDGRGRGRDLPRTRRHPAVPGLSQLGQGEAAVPGRDLRQRQRAGRARHPQPPPAARGGHRLDRHRLQGQRLVRRRRGDPGHRRRSGPRSRSCSTSPPRPSNLAIRAMGRCRYWSEVASLMERFVKSQGLYVVEKFVGHGIGQDMHEEPQVPNFVSTVAATSTTSSSSRASCWPSSRWSRWGPRKSGRSATAGPSRPRTAVPVPTSSTPSP